MKKTIFAALISVTILGIASVTVFLTHSKDYENLPLIIHEAVTETTTESPTEAPTEASTAKQTSAAITATEAPSTESESPATEALTTQALFHRYELNNVTYDELLLIEIISEEDAAKIIELRKTIQYFSHPYELLYCGFSEAYVAELMQYLYVDGADTTKDTQGQ